MVALQDKTFSIFFIEESRKRGITLGTPQDNPPWNCQPFFPFITDYKTFHCYLKTRGQRLKRNVDVYNGAHGI